MEEGVIFIEWFLIVFLKGVFELRFVWKSRLCKDLKKEYFR